MEFQDKIIVVTGGTRGIGRAISLHFASLGGKVTAAYLANEETAQSLVDEAQSLPGSVSVIKADASTQDGTLAIMEAAAKETGGIDILVNNAGIIRDGFLPMMSEGDWSAVIRSNLDSLFHCSKWGARKMLAARKGAIVNLSSISGITGTAGQTNYAASKGAIISFTKSLARELGPMGIRVNAVAPGLIDTEMVSGMKQDLVEKIIKSSSIGRIGRTTEVAEAVAFLASDRASYISGQCLIVDGGIV